MNPGGGCTLKRGQDGDVEEYFAKTTGHGYNDMIALPTLTKESIIDNLAKRFKVMHAPHAAVSDAEPCHVRAFLVSAGRSEPRFCTLAV